MEFGTTLGKTTSGDIGLKIPFGPTGAGSVGPGVSGSNGSTNTSTLDYTYYLPTTINKVDPEATANIAASAVIAPTLSALREGLVRATTQLPCMTDTPKDKDDTFTFAVELKTDANPKVGFNFLILSANVGYDRTSTRANTITVTFHPTPTGGQLLLN